MAAAAAATPPAAEVEKKETKYYVSFPPFPGLVMLHEHLYYPTGPGVYGQLGQSFIRLYLAGGVTTMRTGGNMNGYMDITLKQRVEAGDAAGPTIDATMPYVNGVNPFVQMTNLTTEERARRHVGYWADEGATSVKAYMQISRAALGTAIRGADHSIAIYSAGAVRGRSVVVRDAFGESLGAVDLSAWPPDQELHWAAVEDGVLFLCTYHMTYASSTAGNNAFLTAVALGTGELLWQSEPLVCNTWNFLLRDGWIISGYGFTAEPDHLFVLDAKNVSASRGGRTLFSDVSLLLRRGERIGMAKAVGRVNKDLGF